MDIQFPMILFQAINFGIIVVVLWFLLSKPVLKIFSERAKRIEEGQLAAAKAIAQQEQIAQIKADTEKEMRAKSAELLTQATTEAKLQQQSLIAQAKAQAEAEVKKIRENWKQEQDASITQLQGKLVDAVFAVCNTVLPKALTKKQHEELVDSELSSLLKQL